MNNLKKTPSEKVQQKKVKKNVDHKEEEKKVVKEISTPQEIDDFENFDKVVSDIIRLEFLKPENWTYDIRSEGILTKLFFETPVKNECKFFFF